jgi:WD40 repeat protein
MCFSPDGQILAIGVDASGRQGVRNRGWSDVQPSSLVCLIDTRSGAVARRIATRGYITSLSFSPNGAKLAALSHHKSVYLVNVGTGTVSSTVDVSHRHAEAVLFAADKSLVVCGDKTDVWEPAWGAGAWVLDIETMKCTHALSPVHGQCTGGVFIPRRKGAALIWDDHVSLFDTSTWLEVSVFKLEGSTSQAVSYDGGPNGQLVIGCDAGNIYFLDIAEARADLVLTSRLYPLVAYAWKRRLLAVQKRVEHATLELYEVGSGGALRSLSTDVGTVGATAMCSKQGGDALAVAFENGDIVSYR